MQEARDRVPLERDLRGIAVCVGLGPAWYRAEAQRQSSMVEVDGARPGRRRGPGDARSSCPPRCGRRPATSRPSPTHSSSARTATSDSGPITSISPRTAPSVGRSASVDRASPVQPHVQDPHGARRGLGPRRLPATRDGPGHVRRLRHRAADLPEADPVRDRPAGQELPQRDHPGQLRVPHARVRADGDGVLRQARDR